MAKQFYIIDKNNHHIMSRGYDSKLIAQNASAHYTWYTAEPEKFEIAYGQNAGVPETLVEQPDDETGYFIVNHVDPDKYVSGSGPYDSYNAARRDTSRLEWYSPSTYSIMYGKTDGEHNFEEMDPPK